MPAGAVEIRNVVGALRRVNGEFVLAVRAQAWRDGQLLWPWERPHMALTATRGSAFGFDLEQLAEDAIDDFVRDLRHDGIRPINTTVSVRWEALDPASAAALPHTHRVEPDLDGPHTCDR